MGNLPSRNDLDRERGVLQDRLSDLEPRIRRRLRGKFGALAHRAPSDLDDVLSSARRRLDQTLVMGRVVVRADGKLEAFFQCTAERIAIDLVRRERLRWEMASAASERCTRDPLDVFEGILNTPHPLLSRFNDDERRILELRARGMSHKQIATETGIGVNAHRSRWRRLRARIMLSCTRDP